MIELHDENPEEFKVAPMYIYSLEENTTILDVLATTDDAERSKLIIGAAIIGDKYGVSGLVKSAAVAITSTLSRWEFKVLFPCIDKFYNMCIQSDSAIGKALVTLLLK